MLGGSLTRYDPNRGQRSTGSGRPANQTGGLSIKGLDTVRVIQSLPAELKRKATSLTNRLPANLKRKATSLKRKATALTNRLPIKKKKRIIRDIFA